MRGAIGRLATFGLALALLGACGGGAGGERGAGAGATFCDAVRAYASLAQDAAVAVNVDSSMSADEVERRINEAEHRLQQQVQRGGQVLDELQARAPDAIDADVTVVVAAERRTLAALEASGYDPFALLGDPSVRPDPAAAAALERVNGYTVEACGTTLKPLPPDMPQVPDVPAPGVPGTPGTPGAPGVPGVPGAPAVRVG